MAVAMSASLGSFAKGSKTFMSVTSLCFRKSVYGLEGPLFAAHVVQDICQRAPAVA